MHPASTVKITEGIEGKLYEGCLYCAGTIGASAFEKCELQGTNYFYVRSFGSNNENNTFALGASAFRGMTNVSGITLEPQKDGLI
jgi:hypothetical protein